MKIIGTEDTNVSSKKQSYWKYGKEQYKAFNNYHVKKTTFISTTLLGMLITLVVIFAPLLLLIQLFQTYYYNPSIKLLLVVIAWALLLLCNGLSNYYTVILTKNHAVDDQKLQAFDEKAIMFYNTFNIGFIIFTFIIMMALVIGVI